MRRVAVVVALVVVLSGCNAFGAEETRPETPDVSPAPVPTSGPGPGPTATSTPGTCLAPRPATPAPVTVTTPSEPVALPGENETVNASALVALHAAELATHRYHLRIDNRTEVWSLPNASAFTYEGFDLGLQPLRAYAVAGTLYTLQRDAGELQVGERPYRTGSAVQERYRDVLTGRVWLQETIGRYDYRVVDTRVWNGTAVRVLRDTLDQRLLLAADSRKDGLVGINSTLYVDRRGIVRYVRHVRNLEIQYGNDEYRNRTEIRTLRVDSVGTTRIRRPAGFCVRNPDSVEVTTATPTATPRAPPSGPTSVTATPATTASPVAPTPATTGAPDTATPVVANGTTDAGTATAGDASGT